MHKILIKGYFKNCDINEIIKYNNYGHLLNNMIIFDSNNSKLKINFKNNKIIFTKEDDESKLEYEFIENKKTFGKYYLKKEKLILDIPIYTTIIEKKDKLLKIEYDLINNNKNSKNILYIEYEVFK